MTINKRALGRRIASARHACAFSVEELAARIGKSPGTIRAWERGRYAPRHADLVALAEALGKPPAWFYGQDERPPEAVAALIEEQQRELEELRKLILREPEALGLHPVSGMVAIKVLGTVPAGDPKLAIEAAEETISVPVDFLPKGVPAERMYFLRVQGESMEDAGIREGSFVLVCPDLEVRDGDVAVVMTDEDEVTVKRVYFKADGVLLVPCNGSMAPKVVHRARILGRVTGCWHRY